MFRWGAPDTLGGHLKQVAQTVKRVRKKLHIKDIKAAEGHPAYVNQSGLGIATDIICLLKKFGFREAELKSHLKGAVYDAQLTLINDFI